MEVVIVVLLIGAWSGIRTRYQSLQAHASRPWLGVFLAVAMLVWLLILAVIVSSE